MSVFSEVVRFREPGWSWLGEEIVALRNDFDLDRFLSCFAQVTRHLEGEIPDDLTVLSKATSIDFGKWSADEMGRAHFLLSFADFPEARLRETVEKCYRYGDNREQIAVLKALSLLPYRENFSSVALMGCRSNVVPVFAALALNNPYPAAVFSDHAFNNLVLKAIFLGLTVREIVGLNERKNRVLAQMIEDFLDEREAAHRPISPQIWQIICPFADEERLNRAYHYLAGEESPKAPQGFLSPCRGGDEAQGVEHRRAVAHSLGETANPRHLGLLSERLKSETDAEVKKAIESAIYRIEASAKKEKK